VTETVVTLLANEEKQLVESVAGISPELLSLHPDLKQTILFHW